MSPNGNEENAPNDHHHVMKASGNANAIQAAMSIQSRAWGRQNVHVAVRPISEISDNIPRWSWISVETSESS